MKWLRSETTGDRIVLLFAATIALLLVIDVVAIIVLTITTPDADLAPFITASSEIIAMMLGALVGYIGGLRSNDPG